MVNPMTNLVMLNTLSEFRPPRTAQVGLMASSRRGWPERRAERDSSMLFFLGKEEESSVLCAFGVVFAIRAFDLELSICPLPCLLEEGW